MNRQITVIDHPLVQHKLTYLRDKTTPHAVFRTLLKEVSMLMAYEVTRDLPLHTVTIETPLATTQAPVLQTPDIVLVSILRAGTGLLDGMLEVLPFARVGHVGVYREPETLRAVEYYFKMPPDLPNRDLFVLDPMLATGHSAVAAFDRILERNPRSARFVCLLAAPEGIDYFHRHHPEVPIYTAAIDERLDEHGYIVPGLGDAGDRIFGTR